VFAMLASVPVLCSGPGGHHGEISVARGHEAENWPRARAEILWLAMQIKFERLFERFREGYHRLLETLSASPTRFFVDLSWSLAWLQSWRCFRGWGRISSPRWMPANFKLHIRARTGSG